MSLHEIDLAQKISDKILCVKGDTIFGYGEPEAIFKEDFIQKLYEIDNGHFDPVFGSVELAKAEGEAEVFVISSGGSGIPCLPEPSESKEFHFRQESCILMILTIIWQNIWQSV